MTFRYDLSRGGPCGRALHCSGKGALIVRENSAHDEAISVPNRNWLKWQVPVRRAGGDRRAERGEIVDRGGPTGSTISELLKRGQTVLYQSSSGIFGDGERSPRGACPNPREALQGREWEGEFRPTRRFRAHGHWGGEVKGVSGNQGSRPFSQSHLRKSI